MLLVPCAMAQYNGSDLDPATFLQVDDQRRTHNYDDFIITFLTMLAEQGKLQDIVQEKRTSNALARRKPRAVANATSASGGKGKKRK